MPSTLKVGAISAAVGLVLGLVLGFVPEHSKLSSMSESSAATESRLSEAQTKLTLSSFAVRAASLEEQAEVNNFSIASGTASSLFTDLRQYTDQTQDQSVKSQLEQVLSARDHVITGLAQADPAVKGQLQQIFLRLQKLTA